MINLISDTVTKPTAAMLETMFSAQVGDDVFDEDPTVHELEAKSAELFGHEDSIFCPSGTMANQIAQKLHTVALDEIICEWNSHIFQYELAGYSFLSSVAILPLKTPNGKLSALDVSSAIRAPADWLPNSKLVILENTGNRMGGSCYELHEMKEVSECARANGLSIHLDGARIFNAIVAKGYKSKDLGPLFDSVSVCLSKGLGAPVGTMLIGSADFVQRARKIRKALGGGMRQIGYLAAAGIYALDHHIDRLAIDHQLAKRIGDHVEKQASHENLRPVETNIVLFDVKAPHTAAQYADYLLKNGVKVSIFGPQTIRMVTHLDVSTDQIDEVLSVMEKFS